ncbi:Uncharacterised protein [Mycobacteroides abscessus subsp. abscessus]|nr:Uncharacterised protein [Mycobacteroides abscessus subsp. abscessus]
MINVQTLSSIPSFPTITYSGMIAATMGSIFVLMKKNRASLVLRTGRSDSAKAAGTPRSNTRIVETTVAHNEFSSGVPIPASNTLRNCCRVGVKKKVGGLVAASLSCLNAVNTIHNTGKKNPMASIQVIAVSTPPRGSRRRRMVGVSVEGDVDVVGVAVAVIRLPPRFR